jgi:hypothetical protein
MERVTESQVQEALGDHRSRENARIAPGDPMIHIA